MVSTNVVVIYDHPPPTLVSPPVTPTPVRVAVRGVPRAQHSLVTERRSGQKIGLSKGQPVCTPKPQPLLEKRLAKPFGRLLLLYYWRTLLPPTPHTLGPIIRGRGSQMSHVDIKKLQCHMYLPLIFSIVEFKKILCPMSLYS